MITLNEPSSLSLIKDTSIELNKTDEAYKKPNTVYINQEFFKTKADYETVVKKIENDGKVFISTYI